MVALTTDIAYYTYMDRGNTAKAKTKMVKKMGNAKHTVKGNTVFSGDFGAAKLVGWIAVVHNENIDMGDDYYPAYADADMVFCHIGQESSYRLMDTGLHLLHDDSGKQVADSYPQTNFTWVRSQNRKEMKNRLS